MVNLSCSAYVLRQPGFTPHLFRNHQYLYYTCDALKVDTLTRTSVRATATATATNVQPSQVTGFDWGDSSNVTQTGPVLDHTYAKEGAYTIRASVLVTVGGENKVVVSDACVKQISIQPEMCTVPGLENFPVGSPECTKSPYCRISDKATVSLYPSEVTTMTRQISASCAANTSCPRILTRVSRCARWKSPASPPDFSTILLRSQSDAQSAASSKLDAHNQKTPSSRRSFLLT